MQQRSVKHALFLFVIGLFLTFSQTAAAQSALDGFDPNANATVRAIVVQADGKILIAGDFTTVLGVTRNRIARLNPDGTLDTGFNPNADNIVRSIAVQSDGKILVGGDFASIGGQPRSRIARLDAVTGVPDSWDPNVSALGFVNAIAVQTDGKILAGGEFINIGGQGRSNIARLDAATGAADSWNPAPNGSVQSIAVQSDGKILAGGFFTGIGGQPRNRIARLDAVSGNADSWDPNVNGTVYSIAVQSDGKILAGGSYSVISGQTRNSFTRLSNDTAALSTLAVTQTTLTLTRDGSAAQFHRVIFEQSIDNGANWTLLGTATNSLTSINGGNTTVRECVNCSNKNTLPDGRVSALKDANPFAPNAAGYTLGGQNIPTNLNVLIRARGFYRTGYQNGSETTEDKVRNVFLVAPVAANASVSGRVLTANGNGVRNAVVTLTNSNGITRTARTSSFGYYSFEDVEAGATYIIAVRSKRFVFSPQVVSVNDNISDLDFIGQ